MATMTKQQFLVESGIEVVTLDVWLDREWLLPDRSAPEPAFTALDLARARLIADLIRVFGVNDEGVSVILHLTDQLYGLRQMMLQLRDARERPLNVD